MGCLDAAVDHLTSAAALVLRTLFFRKETAWSFATVRIAGMQGRKDPNEEGFSFRKRRTALSSSDQPSTPSCPFIQPLNRKETGSQLRISKHAE